MVGIATYFDEDATNTFHRNYLLEWLPILNCGNNFSKQWEYIIYVSI